ncbi:phage tail tape measure protein [Aristophania vespae]|uniref:hypothetical protein n=1 Tax=Aristophania vespae TaxID=2697033 RepID=UPI002351B176|nr:hypothetical protein [Aristophania vespae]UMM63827.1 hypothetical protein DM15PD_08040 [Aristophania vespae]
MAYEPTAQSAPQALGQMSGIKTTNSLLSDIKTKIGDLGDKLETICTSFTALNKKIDDAAKSHDVAGKSLDAFKNNADKVKSSIDHTGHLGSGHSISHEAHHHASHGESHEASHRHKNGKVSRPHGSEKEMSEPHEAEKSDSSSVFDGVTLVKIFFENGEFKKNLRDIGEATSLYGKKLNDFLEHERDMLEKKATITGQYSADLAKTDNYLFHTGYNGKKREEELDRDAKVSTAYMTDIGVVSHAGDAIEKNMGISGDQKMGIYGAMGAAGSQDVMGNQPKISFEHFASFIPDLSETAKKVDFKGKNNLIDAIAATAIVRQDTASDKDATDATKSFVGEALTPKFISNLSIQSHDNQLSNNIDNARKSGADPMIIIMEAVHKLLQSSKDPEKTLRSLSKNDGSKTFMRSLSKNLDQYKQVRKKIAGAGEKNVDRAYNAQSNSELVTVKKFEEALTQLMRRLSDDFLPNLVKITEGINSFNAALRDLDKNNKGVTTSLMGVSSAIVAVGAIIIFVGSVFSAIATIFSAVIAVGEFIVAAFEVLELVIAAVAAVLALPIEGAAALVAAIVAAVVAVGYGVYMLIFHFDKVKKFFVDFGNAVSKFFSYLSGLLPKMWDSIKHWWRSDKKSDEKSDQNKAAPADIAEPGASAAAMASAPASKASADAAKKLAESQANPMADIGQNFQFDPQSYGVNAPANDSKDPTGGANVVSFNSHLPAGFNIGASGQNPVNMPQIANLGKNLPAGFNAGALGKNPMGIDPASLSNMGPSPLSLSPANMQKQETVVRLVIEAPKDMKVTAKPVQQPNSHVSVLVDHGQMMMRA